MASKEGEKHLGLARDPSIEAHVVQYLETAMKEQDGQDPTPTKKLAINEVPLARIKRIMKQDSIDPAPRMISVPAILIMAHVSLEFTRLLTSIAWTFFATQDKRNTLQTKDLHHAVHSSQCFDFLIDILDMFEEAQGGADDPEKAGEHQRGAAQLAYQESMQRHLSVQSGMRHGVVGIPSSARPVPTMLMPLGGVVQVPARNPCLPVLNHLFSGTTTENKMPAASLVVPMTAPIYSSIEALHSVRPPTLIPPPRRDGQTRDQQQLARTPSRPLTSQSWDDDQDLLARLPSLSQLPSNLWVRSHDPAHRQQEPLDAYEPVRLPSIDLLAEFASAVDDEMWQDVSGT